MNLKRTPVVLFLAALAAVSLTSWALSKSKNKDSEGYPDYTRLEYSKPLPSVEEQIKQPKPGSISRKFGEVPDNPNKDADPLNSIPIPLLRPASKGNDFEPPITEILEESDQFNASADAKSAAAKAVAASSETPVDVSTPTAEPAKK